MASLQTYFEKRVNELLTHAGEKTFFVFRGFMGDQISYLIRHKNSVLQLPELFAGGTIDLDVLETHKKAINRMLMLSEESLVGIYEELIAIFSVVQDISGIYDGKVVIVNNNLFGNFVPSCLPLSVASALFDYMQSDRGTEDMEMEKVSAYYSDAKILEGRRALLCPINVHKDPKFEVIDFFEGEGAGKGTGDPKNASEIMVGHEEDLLYRLSLMEGGRESVLIRKDRKDSAEYRNLIKALSCLGVPYTTEETDLKASELEYDPAQFLPYLRQYWGPSAAFRDLEFYKDPDCSKEIQGLSQGALVSEIIEQCELAKDGEAARDLFITAPTGAGKSLMFQLPAIYIAEKYGLITVVVSPLIALMNDQVAQLENVRGVTCATCINSSLTFEERQKRIEAIRSGEKSILYLAPELLLATGLPTLCGDRKLGLFVIDEAHTVTSWGRDFRSDYWFLGDFLRATKKRGARFPTLCLTATAVYSGVDDVVNDTIAELDLADPIIHLGNVKRKNIQFDIVCRNKKDYADNLETVKKKLVLKRLREYVQKGEKALAYCPYAAQVDSLYSELSAAEARVIRRYYGQVPKNEKNMTEQEYRQGNIRGLICTKAFGMGVDRADIRHIIHYAPTGTLSDYVQETGRAARDVSLTGTAHMDFFYEDMNYVRKLYGLSEMRQYQLRAMLKKIVDVYDSKKHRNMMIAPDSFLHLFAEKDLIAKVKNGLLMLAKDLKNRYGFPVLIVRPRVMLTRIFVSVPDTLKSRFESEFGPYSRWIGKMPDRFELDRNGQIQRKIYPGTVYSVNIGEVWEKKYSDLSFGAFKQRLYDPEFMKDENGFHIAPRVRINVVYHRPYEEVKRTVDQLVDALLAVLRIHKNAEKKTFDKRQFIAEFKEQPGGSSLDQNQIELILKMITLEVRESLPLRSTPVYKILQKRKQIQNPNEAEYMIRENYSRLKHSMTSWLFSCKPDEENGMEYHSYVPYTKDRSVDILPLLNLMEIAGLASYDMQGGENAEIFLRVNDPDKLKRLAFSVKYNNEVLKEIKRKHEDSQKLLQRFFVTKMTDQERWDFIESYFLGREEEMEWYLMKNTAESGAAE